MTRSSKGTKLDASAVGNEHQKRTAPRAVGAWCRLHGFHGSPLCAKRPEREGGKLGVGGASVPIACSLGAFWTLPPGGVRPRLRDALVLFGRGAVPALLLGIALQRRSRECSGPSHEGACRP